MNAIKTFFQYPANTQNQTPIIAALSAIAVALLPVANNVVSLGSSALAWAAAYVIGLYLMNGNNMIQLVAGALTGNWTYTFPDAGMNTNVIIQDMVGGANQTITNQLTMGSAQIGGGVVGIGNTGISVSSGGTITCAGNNLSIAASLNGQTTSMSNSNSQNGANTGAWNYALVGGTGATGNAGFQCGNIGGQLWSLGLN